MEIYRDIERAREPERPCAENQRCVGGNGGGGGLQEYRAREERGGVQRARRKRRGHNGRDSIRIVRRSGQSDLGLEKWVESDRERDCAHMREGRGVRESEMGREIEMNRERRKREYGYSDTDIEETER